VGDVLDVTPLRWAHGGETVGRVNGKTVFVADALPGERVRARVIADKASWTRAELVEVVEASPDRVTPPCGVFGSCGGCQWQHVDYATQASAKQQIVTDQLQHLGGMTEPPVRQTATPGPAFGYRNRMTFRVDGGMPAMHRRRTRTLVAVPECLLLVPRLEELYGQLGDMRGATAFTLRAGARTGDTLVVIDGQVPAHATSWGASVMRGSRPLIGRPFFHEEVAGVRLRVSGRTFFQVNTDGAEELVRLVAEALEPRADETLLDGYAGAGLFSATVGRRAGRVVAVESNRRAHSDLAVNVEGIDTQIIGSRFEEGVDAVWDIAVVDPPRAGLGARGVEVVTTPRPRAVAYVSCDPASLARDVRLLGATGYECRWITPVDMFPQTFHVETVAAFMRR
jgi:23S rRNA (uracil1939-C5)-methyltransferase